MINNHVGTCPGIMDSDWNTDSDLGFHGVFIQNPSASCHVSDRFAEAIADRSAAFPQHNCAPRSELRNCPRSFSSGRRCGSGPLRLLLRYLSLIHKRLPRGLPPRKRCHYCQGNAQKHLLHVFPFLLSCGNIKRPLFQLNSRAQRTCRYIGFGCSLGRGCWKSLLCSLKPAFSEETL